jgi:acetylornithine/succinyldiaminopimelate/putrescine aminotransferase
MVKLTATTLRAISAANQQSARKKLVPPLPWEVDDVQFSENEAVAESKDERDG